jgi:two-component system, sensor histidine kinase PdtaS
VDVYMRDISERKRVEDALKESEERFRLALRNAPVSVAVQDSNLVFRWAYNQRTWRTDEIVGKTDADLFAPEDVEWLLSLKRRVLESGTEVREQNWVTSHGRRLFLDLYLEPLRDPKGEIIGIGIATLDLTALKNAEMETQRLLTEVQEEKDKLSSLIHSISDEVWFADTQKKFTLANPSALREFGFNAIDGADIESLASSLEVFRPDGTLRPVEEAPPLRALKGEAVRNLEELILTPGREELRYRQVSSNPVRDASGNIIGAVSVVRDITDLKRAEQKLQESEERYRTRFNALIEGFCIIEMVFDEANRPVDYRFLEINPAFEAQTGLHAAQGKLMRDLAPEHEAYWFEMYGKIALTGEPQHFESEAKALNRWYDVRAFRVGGQESRKVAVCFNDITKRKRAEEELKQKNEDLNAALEEIASSQEELSRNVEELRHRERQLQEALAEKEILLSEIHHRVKNNLTAFISLLSLDGSYEETDSGRALRKDLQNRARSMALIHETLYRTGKFSNVDMEIYLTTLVSQIAGTYAGNVVVRTVVNAREMVLDLSRATTAGLIINELVTNSFKYAFPPGFDCVAERGEPCTIRVSLNHETGTYVLTVADNGIGLPKELDPLATKSLGLKLVNFLALHQLRSEINVRAENGTEFVFRLKNPEDLT